MMGDSVQALHYTRHGDRRTNIKPTYAAWPDQSVLYAAAASWINPSPAYLSITVCVLFFF